MRLKMLYKENIGIYHLALCAFIFLLTACSADESQQDGVEDVSLELRAVTRASSGLAEYGDIHVYLTSTDADNIKADGLFKYIHDDENPDKDYWIAQGMKVRPGNRSYRLYGYMPTYDNLSGSMDLDNFTLTINGIDPLSDQDICFITGVEKSEDQIEPERGEFTFEYVNSEYNDRTFLNLGFEHLFGRMAFKFKVGEKYSELRKIKLKSVSIEEPTEVSATILLKKDDPVNPFGYVEYVVTRDTKKTHSLWTPTAPSDGVMLDQTIPTIEVGRSNVAVGTNMEEQYVLVCTYDVYDLKNNLLSERTARNNLKVVLPSMGEERTVTLTIEPTYLYQLSNDDLDNPTVKIN